jgi:hypothetical protein
MKAGQYLLPTFRKLPHIDTADNREEETMKTTRSIPLTFYYRFS